MTEVVPCYKSAKGVQNASFRASWIERGPPIWYSGLKPPFAPPEPRLLASVSVEWPNLNSRREITAKELHQSGRSPVRPPFLLKAQHIADSHANLRVGHIECVRVGSS